MSPAQNPAQADSPGRTTAREYAEALLARCGAPARIRGGRPGPGAELGAEREWARSGAMALTGHADGPPLLAPGPLALCARGAAGALASLAPESLELAGLDGPALLAERACVAGLARRGSLAPGGSCRMLATRTGWLTLNLPRPEDRTLLPAWLEADAQPGEDAWAFVARLGSRREARALADRGRMMGLALAALDEGREPAGAWCRVEAEGRRQAPPSPDAKPRVLDLSSLWAGPLCAQLLAAAGARVIKCESSQRPDGARQGPAAFFDLLNAGKQSVALDLHRHAGVRQLARLIAQADIVVESARPRALAQMGIDARACVRARPGQVWLSITGHGRRGERGHWVGFGDDAAVAGGAVIQAGPLPVFCGDALADPLSGLHAAVAALAHWRAGHGALLDVSLRAVVGHALATDGPDETARVEARGAGKRREWKLITRAGDEPVAAPRARTARARAPALGADTAWVLAQAGDSVEAGAPR